MQHGEYFGRPYAARERLADGMVHLVGMALALIGSVVLLTISLRVGSVWVMLASMVYAAGLLASLTISFAYNMAADGPRRALLRRLDHSAIFVLIAATYTPLLQHGAAHPSIQILMIGIWLMALFGVILKCSYPGRFHGFAIILYLLMGWSGVAAFGPISQNLPTISMVLIVTGGVIYSAGVVFHLWEGLRFQRAIWHGFVVTAAAVHYGAVLTALRAAGA